MFGKSGDNEIYTYREICTIVLANLPKITGDVLRATIYMFPPIYSVKRRGIKKHRVLGKW
jgi:hypothetical protein